MRRWYVPFVLCLALGVSACDGDDDDDSSQPEPPPPETPARGTLLQNPPSLVKSYASAELLAAAGQNEVGQILLDLAFDPKCPVDIYQIQYQTIGGVSEPATASGALMIPGGTDPACAGPRPIVLYGHGTSTDRAFNMANLSGNAEAIAAAVVFAAQGYIVVAPNYAGYDTSSLTYHPYLNANQQSADMIDALAAARSALPVAGTPSATDSGKLFVSGYSQGGFVAMATHRALEASGVSVAASAPLSGPYALSAFGDAIFQGQVSTDAPVNLTLLVASYDVAYGDLFSATSDVFEARYATGIETLLPSTTPLGDLEAQGRIPPDALFSSTPPDPVYASITPATEPAPLASVFAKGFGPDNLITNTYRLSYLQDSQIAPDGGFPLATDGLPPANPTHALRRALKTNDLRNWSPLAPVLLCGGNNDPTVFYFNTQLIQAYWAAAAPTADLTVLNVDAAPVTDDPFETQKVAFSAAKDLVRANAVLGGADDGGDEAVFGVYHPGLVAPACLSAAKSYFDEH